MLEEIKNIEKRIAKYQEMAKCASSESTKDPVGDKKIDYTTQNMHAKKVLQNAQIFENGRQFNGASKRKTPTEMNDSTIISDKPDQLSVIDAALFVINECKKREYSVGNIELQRILYLLWMDYYNAKEEFLFDEYFKAWPVGPVMYEINYAFDALIKKEFSEDSLASTHQQVDFELIRNILPDYLGLKPDDLLDYIGQPFCAWAQTYAMDTLKAESIPFDLIIGTDCKYHKANKPKLMALKAKRLVERQEDASKAIIMRIAQYVIKYYNDADTLIDRMRLDYLMYLLWIEFYEKTEAILFEPAFYITGNCRPILKVIQETYPRDHSYLVISGDIKGIGEITSGFMNETLAATLKITTSDFAEYVKRKEGACYYWHSSADWKNTPVSPECIIEKEIKALNVLPERRVRKKKEEKNEKLETTSNKDTIAKAIERSEKFLWVAKWQENYTKILILKEFLIKKSFEPANDTVKRFSMPLTVKWKEGSITEQILAKVSDILATVSYQPEIYLDIKGNLVMRFSNTEDDMLNLTFDRGPALVRYYIYSEDVDTEASGKMLVTPKPISLGDCEMKNVSAFIELFLSGATLDAISIGLCQ